LEISTEICDENLSRLYGLGLLRLTEKRSTRHSPLLAEYARGLAKEDNKILEALADALGTLSNEAIDTGLPSRFIPLRSHTQPRRHTQKRRNWNPQGILWNNYGYH